MGWNDHIDDEEVDLRNTLRDLIKTECLTDNARGICKQVIGRGVGSLTGTQDFIYRTEIVEQFLKKTCPCCDEEIPLADIPGFLMNGKCGKCCYREEREQKE